MTDWVSCPGCHAPLHPDVVIKATKPKHPHDPRDWEGSHSINCPQCGAETLVHIEIEIRMEND
jgi:hypothetical protein